MVDYVREKKPIDKQIICPKCYNCLTGYSLFKGEKDDSGRHTRHYMGWCSSCDIGFEVVQFKKDDKWHLQKYRYYAAVLDIDKPVPAAGWVTLERVPEPPAVVTGPGGDYTKSWDLKGEQIKLLKTVHNSLTSVLNAIKTMIEFEAHGK